MEDINISNVIQLLKTFMENEQWDKAYSLLTKNKALFDEGVYHYNLGIIKVHLNDLSNARYHFEMSKVNGLNSPEVASSLQNVIEQLNINFLENNHSISDVLHRIIFDLPPDFYISLTLITVTVVLINFKKIEGLLVKFIITVGALLPVLFLLLFIRPKIVAIATSEISVHNGPSRIFEQVEEIPNGAKIIISDEYNGWKKIVYPEKLQGWIFSKRFKLIQD